MSSLKFIFTQLFLIPALLSCDSYFSFSPYEAGLEESFHHTTEKNLRLINAFDAGDSELFKVALLSDPHYHFNKLSDVIDHINNKKDIAFAIVTGDLTENGLMKEFIFFYQVMEKLKIPFVTVIGNHDYLSNGEKVYAQMFGEFNYTFVFNNIKFVLFDNIFWESEKVPDFEWFAAALKNDQGYDHVIPLSHIPPFDNQMFNHQIPYHELMVEHNIRVSIHGHRHDFSLQTLYGNDVQYLTISSPQKRTYSELTITPSEIRVEKIEY